MGRFRVQYVYDEDDGDNDPMDIEEEEEDEMSGIWKGALVRMTHHRPQNSSDDNNGMDLPSPRSEGIMAFTPPSVSIRRPRRRRDDSNSDIVVENNDDDHAVAFPPTNYQNNEYGYPPPPKPWLSWKNIIIFAVMAHLVARYGPVAPPPAADSENWEEFWLRELRGLWRTTKLVGYTIPKYVTEWVVVGLWDDAQYYYQRYQSYNSVQKELEFWSSCSLQIPTNDGKGDWNLEYPATGGMDQIDSHNNNDYQIVGQSRAVQITTQALDAWAQSSPLLLYFAGSRGVGKLELARQIGQRLFGHCAQNNNSNNGDGENSSTDNGRASETSQDLFSSAGSPVLILHGRDFSTRTALEETTFDYSEILSEIEGKGQESTQKQRSLDDTGAANQQYAGVSARAFRVELYETLLRHTHQHPNGTVVILQHAEEAVEGLIASLVHDLTNPSQHISTLDRANSYPHAGDNQQSQQSLASRLQRACAKTIFILTSNTGSKTIASSIRSYGGISNIPPLELDLMLMHELDTFYSADQHNEGTSSSTQRRPSNVEVGSKFHVVAPFYPLELPSMANILTQKVHQWARYQSRFHAEYPSSWDVTLNGLSGLLDSSRVEYLSMVKKSTQTPILTFSSSGAHFLRDGSSMMNSWQAAVKRCFRDRRSKGGEDYANGEAAKDDNSNDNNNNNRRKLLPKEKAILDYDQVTRKVIISISPNVKDDETQELTKELCRFSL